ncbi:hypothetical protein HPB50_019539 [Hyalomma asiaticum]|uniref:Uncharacterized protein n=1 Tax=Hyalomma asiaticum TaxID=266040 RepID=A0ACB7SZZ7_HYAAI|nr:hypothetical protein HPB50_019539 [Hyalomma asiaticum]
MFAYKHLVFLYILPFNGVVHRDKQRARRASFSLSPNGSEGLHVRAPLPELRKERTKTALSRPPHLPSLEEASTHRGSGVGMWVSREFVSLRDCRAAADYLEVRAT